MGLPRIRSSILRLMALVLLIAVGLAAAMAGAFTFTVVTLSATTIGAVLSQGSSRAFFLGCTVFGWAAMLLAFGAGPDIRLALPTTRPIIRIYGAINAGHSLISLALGLAGGAVMWLIVNLRKHRVEQSESPSRVGGPPA